MAPEPAVHRFARAGHREGSGAEPDFPVGREHDAPRANCRRRGDAAAAEPGGRGPAVQRLHDPEDRCSARPRRAPFAASAPNPAPPRRRRRSRPASARAARAARRPHRREPAAKPRELRRRGAAKATARRSARSRTMNRDDEIAPRRRSTRAATPAARHHVGDAAPVEPPTAGDAHDARAPAADGARSPATSRSRSKIASRATSPIAAKTPSMPSPRRWASIKQAGQRRRSARAGIYYVKIRSR